METLWSKGPCSIRELLEAFPSSNRLAYTTVQTVVYRLEEKKAVCRTSKFGNAHVFEAVLSRDSAQHRMIDDLVTLFGGRRLPIVTHLIESGKLSPEELRQLEAICRVDQPGADAQLLGRPAHRTFQEVDNPQASCKRGKGEQEEDRTEGHQCEQRRLGPEQLRPATIHGEHDVVFADDGG